MEDFIRREVLPRYANTHTESSGSGWQTTRLREDARRLIHQAVGGGDRDLVIFCGSGATAAVDKLVGLLGLRDAGRGRPPRVPARQRPVVLVGPYEHHSNDLPWRKSIADVVAIGEDRDGGVDLTELETALVCLAVAALLHRHGALSLWDYTAAAPYVPIRMGESASGRGDHKDAVFFSPHKFVGGPQTPGVLVVRRELVGDRAPIVPGGGTIAFVSPSGRVYLDDPVAREEGRHPRLLSAQHTTDDVARFLANFAAFAAALRP